jgi:ATP-dependent HslUV protease ATP-binding subunit HslU
MLRNNLFKFESKSLHKKFHSKKIKRRFQTQRNTNEILHERDVFHNDINKLIGKINTTELFPENDVVNMHPEDIMEKLNESIIGQEDAKKAISVAMRNRWRFKRLPKEVQKDFISKNILMSGPTGVGKTEIARRVSKITLSPFIKVEATKYTEVGFRGDDVDSIIKGLMTNAFNAEKDRFATSSKEILSVHVDEHLLNELLNIKNAPELDRQKESIGKLLKSGQFDQAVINPKALEFNSYYFHQNVNDYKRQILNYAMHYLQHHHEKDITIRAKKAVEEEGIVFIDEIDKLCSTDPWKPDSSDEGVQRDLLPIVEGTKIKTNQGDVDTSNILFIAAGAFHNSKVSDLLAEFLGRFPIRVQLQPLTEDDMYRVLTEPSVNLLVQQRALLETEGIDIRFTDDAIRRIAYYATKINDTVEDIGARRLHSVIEKLMEDFQFNTEDYIGKTMVIEKDFVDTHLTSLLERQETKHYIL